MTKQDAKRTSEETTTSQTTHTSQKKETEQDKTAMSHEFIIVAGSLIMICFPWVIHVPLKMYV